MFRKLAMSSGRMTSAVPIASNLESSRSKTLARSGCCSAKRAHSVKNIPHHVLGIRRREVDARLRTHDDQVDLSAQGIGAGARLLASQPIEVAQVADAVLPHAIHRI